MPRPVSAQIATIALAVAVAGCGVAHRTPAQHRPASTTFRAAGVSARIPPGWHVSDVQLTGMSSPVQRLVVTSFPVHQDRPDGGCHPSTALREMPADGALLFMFEFEGPTRHDARREPPRPRRFRLDRRTLLPYECVGRSYMVRFSDHGRVFQAHTFLGPRAGAATRRQLLSVLDSLRIRPATPRAAAVWVPPGRLLARTYLGVACHRPNWFGCDRLGVAVWLRSAALAVSATVDGRPVELDDPRWSGRRRGGRRRMFAGFLQPAGMLRGPLRIRTPDGSRYWLGNNPPVRAGLGLTIEQRADHYVRTSLVVGLAPGWG